MQIAPTQDAILERIGYTIAELHEDVTSAPLPARICYLLRRPHTQTQESNVLCAFIEALTHPEQFAFEEGEGELFLIRRELIGGNGRRVERPGADAASASDEQRDGEL